MEIKSVQDLTVETLCDLYTAEQKQLEAFPQLMQAVQTPELREALQQHEQQTRSHIDRLKQVFQKLGQQPHDIQDPVLDAMVQHAQQVLQAQGDQQVKEAALIAEAQKFEHMEIAGYGTAAAFCKIMGDQDCAQMLVGILDEEKQSDARLSEIAESQTNIRASQQAM